MQTYDVVVIGAGPSGSIAAAQLAQAGFTVALLEKQFLPRHKTCGGGMPMVMQSQLQDLAPEAFVESDVTQMRHTWKFEDPYLVSMNPRSTDERLSLWMVQRPLFDNALAQRASQFGAELRDGIALRSLEPEPDGVIVRAQGIKTGAEFTAKARYVIGADGANGVVAKATQLRKRKAIALAMEIEHPHQWGEGHADLRPDIAHLEYGAVKRGYAWIFPKADHLNIGAGVFRPDNQDARRDRDLPAQLQKTILEYMDALGLKYDRSALKFHAHPLPTWSGKEPLHEGRILLVGDAAGLINPLFGDGILHAVKSGAIAAQSIIDQAADEYTDRIHAEFAANFDAALNLARVFYQWTGVCYKYGVKYEKSTRYATQLLCGDLLFTDMAGRAMRRLKKSVGSNFFPAFNS
ncbi:MAG: geranylgeranyl reductase family protein [Leptolyngbya sp. UWPOB_LEPTO1]|uniref:geranylgeranyl reductase family protein n=1 Tax=Leptolyngbya sp. UWPOB_LEPTO1 TaxID=2815653 RepID=UPI001ACF88C3|nr:geranylgeranyl reductase family protein [Leptolyngbya sp. UWPOB_LEPTO1]MBN8560437.1 geranylgeranyl reductase family protein [Leptolyngbya sp. UWPOB_LEPTO1]